MRVTPSFCLRRSLPKKHNPIKSPKTRLFGLPESDRVPPGREGVEEMSTDTIESHPTFICPDSGWPAQRSLPAGGPGRPSWRPLAGHGLECVSALDVTAVNDFLFFTVISRIRKSAHMALCYFVLGAFLPSLPGWFCNAHLLIKT